MRAGKGVLAAGCCRWLRMRPPPAGRCVAAKPTAAARKGGFGSPGPPAPAAASKCIQLSISGADPEALTLLRDRVNRVLLRCAGVGSGGVSGSENSLGKDPGKAGAAQAGTARPARRPLAPRSLNTLGGAAGAASSGGCGSVVSLRSGPGGSGAPAPSGFSLGVSSRPAALASSADSGSAAAGGGEDLGELSDEQRRALELVRSGRSIFFTGGSVL